VLPARVAARPNYFAAAALFAGAGLYSLAQITRAEEEHKVDLVLCKAAELTEGVPRSIQVGDNKDNFVVVALVGGRPYAVSGKCPHFGANLAQGFLDGYHLYCPWHVAAFDIRTGEMVGGPSLNVLKSYPARVSSTGDLIITVNEDKLEQLAASRISGLMAKRDPADLRTFVIVGGGAAGQSAAETLRRDGYTGRLVLISNEPVVPYDRVLLSKNLKGDAGKFALRPSSFFHDYDIELMLNSEVTQVDAAAKKVKTADGSEVTYDKLLVATGCSAKIPGPFKAAAQNVKNVNAIRSVADYEKVVKSVNSAQSVVIIGASFLGLEAATSIKRTFPDKQVTIIDTVKAPLANVFGSEIAKQLVDLQGLSGVRIVPGVGIKKINDVDGAFAGVTIVHNNEFRGPLDEEVAGQALILATGSELHTEYLPPALLNADGSVRVNSHLRTDSSDIFAAGDIASHFNLLTESQVRIEHWAVAQNQGIRAAHNMLDRGLNYSEVPFFWTNQFGNAQFAGFSNGADWTWTESTADKGPRETGRITYFYKEGRPIGVATINSPGAILRLKVALEKGLMPSKEELASGHVKYADIAARVAMAVRVKSSDCLCSKS
jgi:NADPH-dependent 2,4-dienoyl-CoA reductase/sulfur reductase-like enzyme/nitrite reductase/ring-hydroxylating ferredoxin subunit